MSENTTLTTKDIIEVVNEHSQVDRQWYWKRSDFWHWGFAGRPERIPAVCELAAQYYNGDIVEIGCADGITTEGLAKVAQRHGRKVIAIDPWQREPKDYERFMERMISYGDVLDVLRMKSQDLGVIRYLKAHKLCFVFIDGEHTYQALKSDIQAVYHAAIIACDEILWDWPMLRAFHEAAGDRQKVRHPYCNEAYIV